MYDENENNREDTNRGKTRDVQNHEKEGASRRDCKERVCIRRNI